MSFHIPCFKTNKIFFNCTCSICGNNQERICILDTKFDIKDCCRSLVCKECLKKNDSKRCLVCGLNDGCRSIFFKFIGRDEFEKMFYQYEYWSRLLKRMPFLNSFASTRLFGFWEDIIHILTTEDLKCKNSLLMAYNEHVKNFFRRKMLFYAMRSLPIKVFFNFQRTPLMLNFFETEKFSTYNMRRVFLLKRYESGFVTMFFKKLSVENQEFKQHVFRMLLKRFLSKRI